MTFDPAALLDLRETPHPGLFDGIDKAWDALKRIAPWLEANLRPANHGRVEGAPFLGPRLFIGEGTVIEPGAVVKGPAWIGRDCQIRAGCYIRENVILGDGVVAGNSCEFKNAVLFNRCEVPHFNYVGDSILGFRAHLGAGVILSNVKLTRDNITLRHNGETFDTGLRKFGAIIGDRTEIGCNAVVNPGSVLGRDCLVYPGTQWSGVLESGHIVKLLQQRQVIARRS